MSIWRLVDKNVNIRSLAGFSASMRSKQIQCCYAMSPKLGLALSLAMTLARSMCALLQIPSDSHGYAATEATARSGT
jgi:hypothetical protein